jgi:hypothetical protein
MHRAQQRALHFQRSGAEPQRARWKYSIICFIIKSK